MWWGVLLEGTLSPPSRHSSKDGGSRFPRNNGNSLPNRDKATGEWRKLHNEELNDLYSLPNVVWVVKSRRMKLVGREAHMGEESGVHRVLVGKPEGKSLLGRIILSWIFRKLEGVLGTGWSWLRIGTGGGHL
jgi:hypothetical protein